MGKGKRSQRGQTRRISVRAVRRDKPDLRRLSRALIAQAIAEAEAEAKAQAEHETEERRDAS